MSSEIRTRTMPDEATMAEPDTASSPWAVLEEHLASARRAILAEIRSYPPPIAACDQQFNHLLEQRDAIARELSRLASLHRDNAADTECEAILAFIRGSPFIAEELKAQLVRRYGAKRDGSGWCA